MAYHVYHTEAIILGGRPSGEGDRTLFCYTRELGLVYAHARSVRESRSRLRYVLQTFSYVEVDLIRGKYGWKLISARPIDSFSLLWKHAAKRLVVAEHAHLLRRMIQGEEEHRLLFDDVLAGLRFLTDLESVEELRAAELVFVVRMLARLGYWESHETDTPLLDGNEWSMGMLAAAHADRKALLFGVNQALAASQL